VIVRNKHTIPYLKIWSIGESEPFKAEIALQGVRENGFNIIEYFLGMVDTFSVKIGITYNIKSTHA
jgi:hypothetical protein